MGFMQSVPDDITRTRDDIMRRLPSGKLAPRICLTCYNPIPCDHHPARDADGVMLAPPALHATGKSPETTEHEHCSIAAPETSNAASLTQSTKHPNSGGALAPYEYEDVAELRRTLQVPQLIENTVAFCQSVLDCYRIADAEETQFTEEFARLKKRAEYLTSRHVCIEQNKGKGVLVPHFVDAHLKEVEQWVCDCERFSQSFYTESAAQ